MATNTSKTVNGSGSTAASQFDAHPEYTERSADWCFLHDSYKGDRRIKEQTTKYLPATAGQRALGLGNRTSSNANQSTRQEGQQLYDAYILRARYPDWFRRTVHKLIGLVTREEAVIELPDRLKPLIESATSQGETLQNLLGKILEHQFRFGRFGLLIDIDAKRNLPYFASYQALSIANWDDTVEEDGDEVVRRLEFVLLDESRYERTASGVATRENRGWQWIQKSRTLGLNNGVYTVQVEHRGAVRDEVTPNIQGRTLDKIPFVFVNAMDTLPQPDDAPLMGLAEISLQAYRTDADYRQALFNQGQDTLVVKGGQMAGSDPRDKEEVKEPSAIVGAGAMIMVPVEGDAKFIGVESQGLAELRNALQDAKEEAGEYGGELLSAAGGGESGAALVTRVGARTATLPGMVKTAAAALEQGLRICAEWVGADPEAVSVKPNMDFVEDPMSGQEATQWIGAKNLGFPISMRSIHELAQARDVTSRSFEEELKEIEAEETSLPESMSGGGSSDRDGGEGAGELETDPEGDENGGEDPRNQPGSRDDGRNSQDQ